MKENEYPPEFEKLWTEMGKEELKPITYMGYLQACKFLNELRRAIWETKKKDNKDM